MWAGGKPLVLSKEPLLTVRRIGGEIAAADGLADVVSAVADATTSHLGAGAVVLVLVDESLSTISPVVAAGVSPATSELVAAPIPLEAGMPATAVLESGRPLLLASKDERDRAFPLYAAFPTEQGSWAVLPLVTRDRPVGVLSLGWREEQEFSEEDESLLETVADRCAAAIDRAQALEAARAERATLELLGEGTRLMVSALDPDEIVTRLVELAVPRLAKWCAVYAVEQHRLRRVALRVIDEGSVAGGLAEVRTLPLGGDGPLERAYRSGEMQVVDDVTFEVIETYYPSDLARTVVDSFGRATWSLLAVPVLAGGETIGVMTLSSNKWSKGPLRRLLYAAAEGLAGRAGIALTNAGRFQREHEIAVALTRALMPTSGVGIEGFDTATRYLPKGGAVAGDWFDVAPLGSKRYLVGLGDSVGHGIEAAAMAAEVRSAARAFAMSGDTPAGVLRDLGRLLDTTSPDAMATALYAIVVASDDTVTWASAGHLPPLLWEEDGARYLETARSAPLGHLVARLPPLDVTVRLPPGSGLVFFTDGIVERRHHDIDTRLEVLRSLVEAHRHLGAEEIAEAIVAELCDEPEDDCCLVVIRRLEQPPFAGA